MNNDAKLIMEKALHDAMPGEAVKSALGKIGLSDGGKTVVVSVGKAGWEMANAAWELSGDRIDSGIVITKYDHAKGAIGKLMIREAAHPVPDGNGYAATDEALSLVSGLSERDRVLFLLSGGGSALFEKPLIEAEEMADITKQLLSCGAGIVEINTIRKRLSGVKGGRFALSCAPAHVYTVVLSDIIGDPLDMIASGPAYPDSSTCAEAEEIVRRYGLKLSPEAYGLIRTETPKELNNVTTFVMGSVKQLCASAAEKCRELGYEPIVLTSSLSCEAREAGAFLGAIARDHRKENRSVAFIAGGETVVHLKGHGKGGRNQEIALSAAREIDGCTDICVFSFGSDGTDGPTDAAGGYVDGESAGKLRSCGLSIDDILSDNDAYNGLRAIDGLIFTGATGTNVNDLSVALIRR